jgi:hypothetical protein
MINQTQAIANLKRTLEIDEKVGELSRQIRENKLNMLEKIKRIAEIKTLMEEHIEIRKQLIKQMEDDMNATIG